MEAATRHSASANGETATDEPFSQLISPRCCEWEVIVQGDEGPFGGVAQVLGCHGVTVGHQEREEEEVEQEVESDGEKTLKERCACPWMG